MSLDVAVRVRSVRCDPENALPEIQYAGRIRGEGLQEFSADSGTTLYRAELGNELRLEVTGKVDLAEAMGLVLAFWQPKSYELHKPPARLLVEWPAENSWHGFSDRTYVHVVAIVDDNVVEFIAGNRLTNSIIWLQTVAPIIFESADFEIDVLPAEEAEQPLLALRVYASYSVSQFRTRRHRLCEAMLAAGHRDLYDVISVFQRREQTHEWQVLSYYSTLLAW
jgi:hypothetical protein